MKKDIYILGIESSCDETAAAVIKNGREVCSNIIFSQIELHKLYGGVVPEIASRKHIEKINQVIKEALSKASMELKDVDGHIAANYIENPDLEPPFMCLVVSGGHTHLVKILDYEKFEIIGKTRDDAAGEAFDKVARALGLGYPGGPKIDKLAREGNKEAIAFPRAKVEDNAFDFSFSGLKSSVLNYLNQCEMKQIEANPADVAASFQYAVIDVLTNHAISAVKEMGMDKLAIAGGVASNSSLRESLQQACDREGIHFYHPSPVFCTDNAAMIGVAGYYAFQNGVRHGLDLNAVPNLKIEDGKSHSYYFGGRKGKPDAFGCSEAVFRFVWEACSVLFFKSISG